MHIFGNRRLEEIGGRAGRRRAQTGVRLVHWTICDEALHLTGFQWYSEASGEVEKKTLQILGVGCDVSSEQSVQGAFDEVVKEFGRVDAVVASAGMLAMSTVLSL